MATDERQPGRADRHRYTPKSWRPDEETYPAARAAAQDAVGSLNAYLRMSIAYLLGLRRDPPPRPEWAERRAASLPDEPPSRPDNATEE